MSRHPGTAVVTGGSAGNGRAIARALAARGYDVAVLARESERLRETENELHGYGVHARGIPCDVADAGQVEEAAKRAETELGPIAVWVNNAMTTVIAPFCEMETKDIQRITDVNYMGYVHGMQSALRRMKPRDRGTIVNIGSGLSYRGIPLQTAYCATKAAIKNLTEGVRAELFHDDSAVHLGMVMPPAVNTPQFAWAKTTMPKLPQAVPPIYQPEIIAEAVLKLIDEQSREIFVGGSTVQVWAGEQILPNAMGHVLAGKKGYASQQSDRPTTEANEEGNLYQPVEMDVAAHGFFDDKAKTDAVILDADNTRLGLVLGGALALFGLGALIGRASKSDDGAAGGGREALPAPQEERLGGAPAAVPPA